MFCPQCGSEVSSGSSFCSVCGARVEASSSPKRVATRPTSLPQTLTPQVGQPLSEVSFKGIAPHGIDPKTGLPYSHRSKIVAGVLQICLGGFGVGRFYTGHTGIAIAQIAVTFLTCGLGAFWPLIDGILLIVGDSPRDAEGKPLRPG